MPRYKWGRFLLAVTTLAALLALGLGCGGALKATADYTAVASTIRSVLNPDSSTYTLSGYVYVNWENYEVAVRAAPVAPGGTLRAASAVLRLIPTSSSATARTSLSGYFEFTDLSAEVTGLTLTVALSGGGEVQFTVDLAASTITPVAES